MPKHEVEFAFLNNTPNTFRFQEVPQVGKKMVSGSLYLKKYLFPKNVQPTIVKVTVEWDE